MIKDSYVSHKWSAALLALLSHQIDPDDMIMLECQTNYRQPYWYLIILNIFVLYIIIHKYILYAMS
jgi:hypothetical protein